MTLSSHMKGRQALAMLPFNNGTYLKIKKGVSRRMTYLSFIYKKETTESEKLPSLRDVIS